MKKRVGLLAALAMCVTVGGVYATWNYADVSGIVPQTTVRSVYLVNPGTLSGEALTITNNTLRIEIDDCYDKDAIDPSAPVAAGVAGDHYADTITASGEITIQYTMAEGNNATDATLYCKVEIYTAAGETAILETELVDGKFNKTELVSAGIVTWTITWADLGVDLIRKGATPEENYCENIYLPTKEAYTNFAAELTTMTQVKLTVALDASKL